MTEKSIVLSTKKQLIDINKNLTNFRAQISIRSEDNSPFYVAFVEQEDLDNEKEIDYQTAETGSIETEIEYNDNKLKNYYLIAVADTPTNCVYSIDLVEIPPNVVQQPTSQQPVSSSPKSESESSGSYNMIIIGAIGLVIAVGVYYLFFTKNSNDEKNEPTPAKVAEPRVIASSSESVAHSPAKPLTAIDRLKKLNIP